MPEKETEVILTGLIAEYRQDPLEWVTRPTNEQDTCPLFILRTLW